MGADCGEHVAQPGLRAGGGLIAAAAIEGGEQAGEAGLQVVHPGAEAGEALREARHGGEVGA